MHVCSQQPSRRRTDLAPLGAGNLPTTGDDAIARWSESAVSFSALECSPEAAAGGAPMFVSFALFESLDEDGRMESFLVFPTEAPSVPADHIRDLRGFPKSRDVDLGPLRFYAESGGLKVRRIVAQYGPPAVTANRDNLEVHIEHVGLPVADHTTGYYSLLLPVGFYGRVHASLEHDETWLEDVRRMLITIELHEYRAGVIRDVSVDAFLRRNADPPLDCLSPRISRVRSQDIYRNWGGPLHYSGVSNFIRAANASLSATAPSLFLCHASSDKPFARKLAIGLAGNGFKVWVDEAEIRVGDSLLEKIEAGILEARYLAVILSKASVRSRWCQEELRMALVRQIGGKSITVLPVLMEDCDIPGFLQEKRYADFRIPTQFEAALVDLCAAIAP